MSRGILALMFLASVGAFVAQTAVEAEDSEEQIYAEGKFFCLNCDIDGGDFPSCCENGWGLPFCCPKMIKLLQEGAKIDKHGLFLCKDNDQCPNIPSLLTPDYEDGDKCCPYTHTCCDDSEYRLESMQALLATFGGLILGSIILSVLSMLCCCGGIACCCGVCCKRTNRGGIIHSVVAYPANSHGIAPQSNVPYSRMPEDHPRGKRSAHAA